MKSALVVLLAAFLSGLCPASNEGGHGGDLIVQRILFARLFAKEILAHSKLLSDKQRETMTAVLNREPVISRPGEKVTAPDEQGRQVEVSAKYDSDTELVTLSYDLCSGQPMPDLTALLLHEAGYSVGLSRSMARRDADLSSDIGYRLVAEDLASHDSILARYSLKQAPVVVPIIVPNVQPPQVLPASTIPGLPRGTSYWAAAYSRKTGVIRTSQSTYSNQFAAEDDALRTCRAATGGASSDCEALFDSWGCGAVAMGDRNGTGWGAYDTREKSEYYALQACQRSDTNCRVRVSLCLSSAPVEQPVPPPLTNPLDVTPPPLVWSTIPALPQGTSYWSAAYSRSAALARSSTRAYYNQADAEADSLRACRAAVGGAASDCEVVFSSWGCGALAIGDSGLSGWAAYGTREISESYALQECQKSTTNCTVRVSRCFAY